MDRRARILLPLLVGGVAALPSLLPVLQGRVFIFRDLVEFFLPMKVFLHDRLMQGDLPLWDPHTYSGRPFLANLQSQVLYPPNVLACLLPMPWGFGLFAAFHLAIAGAGATVWTRSLGLRASAAGCAGLAYGLGGALLSTVDVSNNLSTLAWWPWIAWAGCRLGGTGRARDFLAFTGALALAGLGGEPHLALAGGAFGLLCGWALPRPGPEGAAPRARVRLGLLILAGCFSLGLVLVQVVPFVELIASSDRAGGLPAEQAARHSASLEDGLLYLTPDRGSFDPAGDGAPRPGAQAYLRVLYFGALPLAAALWALWLLVPRGYPELWRAATLGGGSLAIFWLLALGPATPAFAAARGSGLLFGFRYPAKFLVPASLALALLAGLGLHVLLGLSAPERRRALLALSPVPALSALLWVLRHDAAHVHVLIAFFAGAAALALPGRLAGRLLPCIVAVDLLAAHAAVLPAARADELFADTPAAAYAREVDARVYTRPPSLEQMLSAWVASGGQGLEEYARARVEQMAGNVPLALGVDSVRGAAALVPARIDRLLREADRGTGGLQVLGNMGTELFLSHAALPLPGLDLLPFDGPPLYRLVAARPREELVFRWTVGEEERPTPGPWTGSIRVDREPFRAPPSLADGGGTGSVLRARTEPDRRSWQVRSPRAALFLVRDSWYPGWRAYVDGRPARLLRAEYAYQAVAVPAGDHAVELRFEPLSVRLGAAGSLLSLLLLIGVLPRIERAAQARKRAC